MNPEPTISATEVLAQLKKAWPNKTYPDLTACANAAHLINASVDVGRHQRARLSSTNRKRQSPIKGALSETGKAIAFLKSLKKDKVLLEGELKAVEALREKAGRSPHEYTVYGVNWINASIERIDNVTRLVNALMEPLLLYTPAEVTRAQVVANAAWGAWETVPAAVKIIRSPSENSPIVKFVSAVLDQVGGSLAPNTIAAQLKRWEKLKRWDSSSTRDGAE